ncbi:MAG TPA: hypothetical protein HA319_00355 [Nitrosopumilaceae archaeon]|jgi:hypothetical protein|nr:hypothetical protein [Nitrosopumilaceae archaeon]
MDYPVVTESEGVKINPEKMEIDKLYHCVFKDKVLLFFKDQNDMLNCYEIDEKELVDSIKQSVSPDEVERILQKFIEKENLNH